MAMAFHLEFFEVRRPSDRAWKLVPRRKWTGGKEVYNDNNVVFIAPDA